MNGHDSKQTIGGNIADTSGQASRSCCITFNLYHLLIGLVMLQLVVLVILALCMKLSQSVDVECIGGKGERVVCV